MSYLRASMNFIRFATISPVFAEKKTSDSQIIFDHKKSGNFVTWTEAIGSMSFQISFLSWSCCAWLTRRPKNFFRPLQGALMASKITLSFGTWWIGISELFVSFFFLRFICHGLFLRILFFFQISSVFFRSNKRNCLFRAPFFRNIFSDLKKYGHSFP